MTTDTAPSMTSHPMAPTEAERSAIEAGWGYWTSIPWVDGEQGRYLAHELMEAGRRDPVVVAAAHAHRAWLLRTCPAWCTVDHDRLTALASVDALHSRTIGRVQGVSGNVYITLDMTYAEEDGHLEVRGPSVNLEGGAELTVDQVDALIEVLQQARAGLPVGQEV